MDPDDPPPGTSHAEPEPTTPDTLREWSREEDTIVLEAIKNGCTTIDTLVDQLQQNDLLTHRTDEEILDRFTFLMDIILNL